MPRTYKLDRPKMQVEMTRCKLVEHNRNAAVSLDFRALWFACPLPVCALEHSGRNIHKHAAEIIVRDRFDQMIIKASLLGPPAVLFRSPSGHGYERWFSDFLHLSQL